MSKHLSCVVAVGGLAAASQAQVTAAVFSSRVENGRPPTSVLNFAPGESVMVDLAQISGGEPQIKVGRIKLYPTPACRVV